MAMRCTMLHSAELAHAACLCPSQPLGISRLHKCCKCRQQLIVQKAFVELFELVLCCDHVQTCSELNNVLHSHALERLHSNAITDLYTMHTPQNEMLQRMCVVVDHRNSEQKPFFKSAVPHAHHTHTHNHIEKCDPRMANLQQRLLHQQHPGLGTLPLCRHASM